MTILYWSGDLGKVGYRFGSCLWHLGYERSPYRVIVTQSKQLEMNGFGKVIPPQILFFDSKVTAVLVEGKSCFKDIFWQFYKCE